MASNGQETTPDKGSNPLLVVGLGNPGPKYAETRHNAGFWFLDELAQRAVVQPRLQSKLHAETVKTTIEGRDCFLARPTTFMNHSGRAVQAVSAYYKVLPENILVVYDELDLPPGTARLKFDGGHGGHNGIRDTVQCLGTAAFHRLRVGIGHPGVKDAVTPWVLSRPTRDQELLIRQSIGRALDSLPLFSRGQLAEAMKFLHTEAGEG